MESVKDRILKIIDNEQITNREFYRKTGLSNSYLSMTKGIGADALIKIYSAYPKYNFDWVVTGRGEMDYIEPKMLVGTSGEGAMIAVQVLKDEITELQRKLIICHEQKDNLVTGYLPLNKKELDMKKEKVE